MDHRREVFITGLGVVSPWGVGVAPFWNALQSRAGGIRYSTTLDQMALPVKISGEVCGFDPKAHVRPRKSLKVMVRDAQFAVAAAEAARTQAGVGEQIDPERWGVILGADRVRNEFEETEGAFRACLRSDGSLDENLWPTAGAAASPPLAFLKNLPNMEASHISILNDCRGPNNTLQLAECSTLLAIAEAARVIERGAADAMFAGGASARIHPLDWVRMFVYGELSRSPTPETACRPFDQARTGSVHGENCGIFFLESRRSLEARGAVPLGRIAGAGSAFARPTAGPNAWSPALIRAIERALSDANLQPTAVNAIFAHGVSTVLDDGLEARSLAQVTPKIPVTALKSYFGEAGAACGALEAVAALQAMRDDYLPPTLNYDRPDPACPIELVHREPLREPLSHSLLIAFNRHGHAAALVIAKP